MTNKTTNLNWLKQIGNKHLAQSVLDTKAIVVYSSGLDQVLWANASGARLFGGGTISSFLESKFESDHPFLRQLASAVRQLGTERIYRGFRVVDEERSQLLLCEIGYVDFPNDDDSEEKAILISCANPAMEKLREHEFLELALDQMSGFGSIRAICDEFGLIMSLSEQFTQIDILPEELERACSLAGKNISTSLELNTAGEDVINAQLHLLGSKPKRYLVLLEEVSEETSNESDASADEEGLREQPVINEELPDDSDGAGFVGGVVAGMAAASSALFGKRAGDGEQSEDGETDTQIEFAANEHEESSIDEIPAAEPQSSEIDSSPATNDADEVTPPDSSGDESDEEPAEVGDFEFSGEKDPIRFAWTTDTNQVFTSMSEDLAKAVGPNAADVVGRKWSDVARVFGFDLNGEISDLLNNQDTWSGKSVLWPVQGTDMVVPVDLAALPSFSRGRNFDGFRGFGIVRMLDTIVDPDETGLALEGAGIAYASDSSDEIADTGDELSDNNETEHPSNIVDLKDHRSGPPNDDEHKLSNGEHKAFDEIGRKLRDTSRVGVSKQDIKKTEEETIEVEKPDEPETSDGATQQVDTSLLDNLPVPIIIFRGDDILYANGELLELTGYDDFALLRDAGGVDALFDQEIDDDMADVNETVLIDKDGGQMHVKALLKSVPWDDNRAMLMSFRQPKHEELPKSEKIVLDMMQVSELQNILNTATDGIVILSGDGTIQSLNQSAEALYGLSDKKMRGKPVVDLFAVESHESVLSYIQEFQDPSSNSLLNDGREVIGLEAKGGLMPLYITVGEIGNSEKMCVVLRDMTPWKKTREELIDARKQAEEASDQKTEFLARVSHEIRTPLNAIIGFSDVMIEERFGPVDNDRYREYLRDINRSGIHVLDLINDLLDISKIEAGKMELSFEAVDLNKIVAETVALLQPQANGNRVLIRTSLSRAVPNVVADARSIRQIVLNLVSNAIKFTDANGQVIVSTVYEGNGEVALRVRDTGRGMSKEEVVIALKPFRQLNAISETRGHGTGLGLPLTKALVEANKAYLDIESEPGEGTIIHIQFPTQRVLAD